jgi:hypothetical protein
MSHTRKYRTHKSPYGKDSPFRPGRNMKGMRGRWALEYPEYSHPQKRQKPKRGGPADNGATL